MRHYPIPLHFSHQCLNGSATLTTLTHVIPTPGNNDIMVALADLHQTVVSSKSQFRDDSVNREVDLHGHHQVDDWFVAILGDAKTVMGIVAPHVQVPFLRDGSEMEATKAECIWCTLLWSFPQTFAGSLEVNWSQTDYRCTGNSPHPRTSSLGV